MKKHMILLICFFMMCSIIISTGCVADIQNIELADIDNTFKEDYHHLLQVTEHMLSLSRELHVDMIVIRNTHDPVDIGYGKEMPIDEVSFKDELVVLFEKGYIYISLSKNTVYFKRWKKTLTPSYRAGFAYSKNEDKELDIQYIISQKDLSVSNWYFFEEDYEEWRLIDHTSYVS